jgi:hypothetical protein
MCSIVSLAKAHILAIFSFLFSVASFAYVNYDRRVKLVPRARKGKWCVLDPTHDRKETILRGVIEVYNHSSRPNTIVSYRLYTDNNGVHEEFESELYSNTERDQAKPGEGGDEQKFNVTPLTIPPYSGVPVSIQAIIKGKHSLAMGYLPVMVEIEDVFGKRYSTQVKAQR